MALDKANSSGISGKEIFHMEKPKPSKEKGYKASIDKDYHKRLIADIGKRVAAVRAKRDAEEALEQARTLKEAQEKELKWLEAEDRARKAKLEKEEAQRAAEAEEQRREYDATPVSPDYLETAAAFIQGARASIAEGIAATAEERLARPERVTPVTNGEQSKTQLKMNVYEATPEIFDSLAALTKKLSEAVHQEKPMLKSDELISWMEEFVDEGCLLAVDSINRTAQNPQFKTEQAVFGQAMALFHYLHLYVSRFENTLEERKDLKQSLGTMMESQRVMYGTLQGTLQTAYARSHTTLLARSAYILQVLEHPGCDRLRIEADQEIFKNLPNAAHAVIDIRSSTPQVIQTIKEANNGEVIDFIKEGNYVVMRPDQIVELMAIDTPELAEAREDLLSSRTELTRLEERRIQISLDLLTLESAPRPFALERQILEAERGLFQTRNAFETKKIFDASAPNLEQLQGEMEKAQGQLTGLQSQHPHLRIQTLQNELVQIEAKKAEIQREVQAKTAQFDSVQKSLQSVLTRLQKAQALNAGGPSSGRVSTSGPASIPQSSRRAA